MSSLTQDEFVSRFIAHMVKTAGFAAFDDGTSVAAYAEEVAGSYWAEEYYREDGPEACAEADMDYWGED